MSITLESIVPVQADRDELLQLLNLLNTHWHQNEEAFTNRSLAAWPQWCEDQGFRFELLKDLARNLGSTLTYPEGCPGLDQLITALGPAATTAQLLDSLDQDLPQFLEGFDQILQISHEETAALGAQAGGSAKDKVDLAVGVVVATTVLASLGLGIYAYVRRRRQQVVVELQQVVVELDEAVSRDITPEARQKLERLGPNMGVDAQKQAERLYTSSSYPRISGKALGKAKQKIVRTDQKIDDSERAAENRAMHWTKYKISDLNTIKSLYPVTKKVKGEDGEIKLVRGTHLKAILADAVEDDIDSEISRIASYGESILGEEIGAWDPSLLSELEDEGKQELEKAKNELVYETDKAIIDLEKQVVQKTEAVIEVEADLID